MVSTMPRRYVIQPLGRDGSLQIDTTSLGPHSTSWHDRHRIRIVCEFKVWTKMSLSYAQTFNVIQPTLHTNRHISCSSIIKIDIISAWEFQQSQHSGTCSGFLITNSHQFSSRDYRRFLIARPSIMMNYVQPSNA